MPVEEKEAKTYQFTRLTTEPHSNRPRRVGKGAHSHCPPLLASTSPQASLGSRKALVPKTPSFLFCPPCTGHLGTLLVPTLPPREEQETASPTLSPPPLPPAAGASAAAVEGREGWLSFSCPPPAVKFIPLFG